MSTTASNPTPPWDATEPISSDTERTRPRASAGSSPADAETTRTLPPPGHPEPPRAASVARPASEGPHIAPREWRTFSFKTLIFGTLDLVVDSVLNTVLLVVILTFLAVGAATVPALGLGVLILAATVYVMMGAVWLERRRSASSFGLDIRDPQRRRSPHTDWVRVPHQWWLDASDGSLWLGMLHVALTCALGWLMLLPFVVGRAALVLT
ncbi:sensor domain-containing protein, partial [Streptomyces sp. tea 10]|nr:sensor domain-containing protein [Streptomyces sp. tea 10]